MQRSLCTWSTRALISQRRVSSRRLLLAAALIAFMLPATGALAHAILLQSSPANGETVVGPKVPLTFRFNSRIDKLRSRLILTKPDKSTATLPIAPDGATDILTTSADLAPGAYSVRWQVLAIDGHITRGDVAFTVSANN